MTADLIAAVLAAHPGHSWVDKAGPCSGSKLVCHGPDCDWEVDLDGHDGSSRRAIFPAHFAEELAKSGIGSVHEARSQAFQEAADVLSKHDAAGTPDPVDDALTELKSMAAAPA